MWELPEARVIAEQLNAAVRGKRIAAVTAAASPHGFAWYYGDPREYPERLIGKTIGVACARGGLIETAIEDAVLLTGDGTGLRLYHASDTRPARHQLLLEFDDGDALVGTVRMYGGIWAFPAGSFDSPYYRVALEKPSPLSPAFDRRYFQSLFNHPTVEKLPAKAFLATEQRIPGLGNGVLQDILFRAKIHPRRKIADLDTDERETLFTALISILAAMAAGGGRDTETDLYGCVGGYATCMSRRTVGLPCSACGALVRKEAFLGGSIYFCPGCQPRQQD